MSQHGRPTKTGPEEEEKGTHDHDVRVLRKRLREGHASPDGVGRLERYAAHTQPISLMHAHKDKHKDGCEWGWG